MNFQLARRPVNAKDPIDWGRLGLALLVVLVAVLVAVACLVWIAFTPSVAGERRQRFAASRRAPATGPVRAPALILGRKLGATTRSLCMHDHRHNVQRQMVIATGLHNTATSSHDPGPHKLSRNPPAWRFRDSRFPMFDDH
jgi:hypothetical protein